MNKQELEDLKNIFEKNIKNNLNMFPIFFNHNNNPNNFLISLIILLSSISNIYLFY